MGCASSKLDDLPAIILCRERLEFLSTALHQRYALSEAHVAYIHSLQSVGLSLHRFFDSSTEIPPPSPVLDLPTQRKLPVDDFPANNSGHLSHSNSGSHLHFHSDSSDDDEDHHGSGSGSGSSVQHHIHDSPPRAMMHEGTSVGGGGGGEGVGFNPYLYSNGGGNGNGYNMNFNYMKKHVTPSVSYEQKPVSYQTVQYGEFNPSSSGTSFYDYNNNNNNNGYNMNMNSNVNVNSNNNNNNGYMNYGGYFGGGGGGGQGSRGGGGYGGWNGGVGQAVEGPKVAAPPPPPPPPSTSGWDFMNLFESIETHYPSYTPSRDSREVREEEGIPDLEDEDNAHEVVKEVHMVEESSSGTGSSISGVSVNGDSKRVEDQEVVGVGPSQGAGAGAGAGGGDPGVYKGGRTSVSSLQSAPLEYEVHMVDKKVVAGEAKSEHQGKGGSAGRPVFRNAFEVVKEIQVQFERAATSGGELAKVLELGKLRYQRKNAAFQG